MHPVRPLHKQPLFPVCIALTIGMMLYAPLIMGGKSAAITASGASLPDVHFGYSPAAVNQFFDALSPGGLQEYRRLMTVWDAIFPLVYGSMSICWLLLIFGQLTPDKRIKIAAGLFPLLPMCADWLENAWGKSMLESWLTTGAVMDSLAHTASLFTQIKWILAGTSYALLGGGIIGLLLRTFFRRKIS